MLTSVAPGRCDTIFTRWIMTEWVSVNDKLPGWSCYVFVNDGLQSIAISFFDEKDNEFYDIYGCDCLLNSYIPRSDAFVHFKISKIVYWRHLPMSPCEE